ncbi:MAG: family 78 glycoside hydrolase catalytic domain [Lentisphaeria bacterium]|nr:family 78 glycoside hydrolase catalytic domain [Lentisphaeria bacterium]
MKNTLWINLHGEAIDWRCPELPAPMLRKKFDLTAVPGNVMLRFAAPGWAVITINGQPVSKDIMVPAVTQLDKHTGLVEYDVTNLLKTGENVIGVILGNGWYNCGTHELWHFDKASWRNYNRLYLELWADDKKLLASDTTWKGENSAIIFNQFRSGEHFDARKVIPGWDHPGFDDSKWQNAIQVTPPAGTLLKDDSPQCAIRQEIKPVASWIANSDSIVYDFGKNMTGFVRLKVSGDSGSKFTIIYSELIAQNKDVARDNIACYIVDGDTAQIDVYTHDGSSAAVWQPNFAYHGFRYVKLVASGNISVDEITACYIHSNFAENGQFTIGNEVASKLLDCTRNSYIANFTGIPTDCPHREKNGWTGDAQLACETGLWMYDGAKNYEHFVQIIADAQRPSGQLSGIAPAAGWGYNWGNGPVWDVALFEIPYQVWQYTGKTSAIEKSYSNMRSYINYALAMRNADGLLDFGLGDWCHHDRHRIVTVALTSTAFYYYILSLMEKFAGITAPGDAAEYAALKEEIKAVFLKNFRNADGTYAKDEWTANACALYFHLDDSPALAAHLAEQVRANDHKADFGIVGAKLIPRVLADYGYGSDAFKLYTQTGYPGWGYWIEQGATTLWEHWHGGYSQTHIMFGDFTAWCFRNLAGIKILEPGFKKILLAPADVPAAGDFSCSYQTPYGKIEIRKNGNNFSYHVPRDIDCVTKIPESLQTTVF